MRSIYVMVKCDMSQVCKVAADTIDELSELHSTLRHCDLLNKFYLDAPTTLGSSSPSGCSPSLAKDPHTVVTFNACVDEAR